MEMRAPLVWPWGGGLAGDESVTCVKSGIWTFTSDLVLLFSSRKIGISYLLLF